MEAVAAIGPHQITRIGTAPSGESYVVVTFPAGSSTVMSVQPDGWIDTRPGDTRGPYEIGLLTGDRIIFAPEGPNGAVYIIPFTSVIPNEA